MSYYAKRKEAKRERRGKVFIANPAAYVTALKDIGSGSKRRGGLFLEPTKKVLKTAKAKLKKKGKN